MKDQVRPGDIVLESKKWNLVSFLIRKIEHSHWSHGILVVDEKTVIESTGTGVHYTKIENFDFKDTEKFKVLRIKPDLVSKEQLERVIFKARGYIGKSFDFVAIFRLMTAWVFGYRHTVPVDPDARKFYCTEVIARPLHEVANFQFRDDVVPENTTPSDIERSDKVIHIEV